MTPTQIHTCIAMAFQCGFECGQRTCDSVVNGIEEWPQTYADLLDDIQIKLLEDDKCT